MKFALCLPMRLSARCSWWSIRQRRCRWSWSWRPRCCPRRPSWCLPGQQASASPSTRACRWDGHVAADPDRRLESNGRSGTFSALPSALTRVDAGRRPREWAGRLSGWIAGKRVPLVLWPTLRWKVKSLVILCLTLLQNCGTYLCGGWHSAVRIRTTVEAADRWRCS